MAPVFSPEPFFLASKIWFDDVAARQSAPVRNDSEWSGQPTQTMRYEVWQAGLIARWHFALLSWHNKAALQTDQHETIASGQDGGTKPHLSPVLHGGNGRFDFGDERTMFPRISLLEELFVIGHGLWEIARILGEQS